MGKYIELNDQGERIRLLARMAFVVGLVLAIAGARTWHSAATEIHSLEKQYKQVRKSQFVVNVSSSRNHQPHNSYLGWGPQQVFSGYAGKDPRQEYDIRKQTHEVWVPLAKLATGIGVVLLLVSRLVLFQIRRMPQLIEEF